MIKIAKLGELYEAEVTPPHGKQEHWSTSIPITRDALIRELLTLGCHQTDIGDELDRVRKLDLDKKLWAWGKWRREVIPLLTE